MDTPPAGPRPEPKPEASVALEHADPERQEEYAQLGEMSLDELNAKLGQGDNEPGEVAIDEQRMGAPAAPQQDSGLNEDDVVRIIQTVLDIRDENERNKPPPPSSADKDHFLRCVLGGQPYTREYSLFGGAATVTMQDLSAEDQEKIFAQLKADEITTDEDWEVQTDRYHLAMGAVKLTWSAKEGTPAWEGPCEDMTERVNEMLSKSSTVVYRALMGVAREFVRHLNELAEAAQRPDFWETDKGTSLSEPSVGASSTTPAPDETTPD
jgi:hypothetical protein